MKFLLSGFSSPPHPPLAFQIVILNSENLFSAGVLKSSAFGLNSGSGGFVSLLTLPSFSILPQSEEVKGLLHSAECQGVSQVEMGLCPHPRPLLLWPALT